MSIQPIVDRQCSAKSREMVGTDSFELDGIYRIYECEIEQ